MSIPFLGQAVAQWPDGRKARLFADEEGARWESRDTHLEELLNDILVCMPTQHRGVAEVAQSCLEYFLAPVGGALTESAQEDWGEEDELPEGAVD